MNPKPKKIIAPPLDAVKSLKNNWLIHLPSNTAFFAVKGTVSTERERQSSPLVYHFHDSEGIRYDKREVWMPVVGDDVEVKIKDTLGEITEEIAKTLKNSGKSVICVSPPAFFKVMGGGMKRDRDTGEIAYFYLSDANGNQYPLSECFGDRFDFPGIQQWERGKIVSISDSGKLKLPEITVESAIGIINILNFEQAIRKVGK